jgi:pSer/pThr/pTyr-binding forkhead associated (FHA) protein
MEKAAEQSIIRSAFVPLDVWVPGDQRQAQQLMGQPPRSPVYPAQPVPPAGQNWPLPPPPYVQPPQLPIYAPASRDGNGREQQRVLIPVNRRAARVLIEVNGKVISERALNKPMLTVGRLSENDVQIPSQRVSRLHARIHEENGTWVIEDAESLNGLVYRGQRIDRLTLNNGDRIYVAPTAVLQFMMP